MTNEENIFKKIFKIFKGFIKKIEEEFLDEIARRAFVNNAFDGALTLLGILMGNVVLGDVNSKTIMSTGFGACTAMGISGTFGRYFSERAERKQALHTIESYLFTDLSGSIIERESKKKVIFISIIDGLSPALAAIVPLIPFFLVQAAVISMSIGIVFSFVLDFSVLFILGIFLGKISKENIFLHGGLMVAVGFVTSLIIFMISSFFVGI